MVKRKQLPGPVRTQPEIPGVKVFRDVLETYLYDQIWQFVVAHPTLALKKKERAKNTFSTVFEIQDTPFQFKFSFTFDHSNTRVS